MSPHIERRRWRFSRLGLACLAIVCFKPIVSAQNAVDQESDASSGVQVVERGPIHEAYLQRYTQPTTAPVIEREPPEPVMERESDIRSDNPEAIWIPGYWAWDDTRNDFIWVSGIWRVPPPGHVWIKGYWDRDDQGWRWIGGFWSAELENVDYIPDPPPQDQVDEGPVGDPPADNAIWIPGCYQYTGQTYAWNAGYWAAGQPGWIWTPAHYDWTPYGYVYTAGYWDYPLDTRGILFAPVYFPRPLLAQPLIYCPSYTLGTDLFDWVFARAGYRSYYFGNYFGPGFVNLGFSSWYGGYGPSWRRASGYFDPAFWWYRHQYRHETWRDWRERRSTPVRGNLPIERPRKRLEIVHNRNAGPELRPTTPEARRAFERQRLAERTQRPRLTERAVVPASQSGRNRFQAGGNLGENRRDNVNTRAYLDPNQQRREGDRIRENRDLRDPGDRRVRERGPDFPNDRALPGRERFRARGHRRRPQSHWRAPPHRVGERECL